jgi:hypothetical protein
MTDHDPHMTLGRPQPHSRGRKIMRLFVYGLALGLLGASIFWTVKDGDFSALLEARPSQLLTLLGLAFGGGIVAVGLMFSLIYQPFTPRGQRIGLLTMQKLIAASSVLNYTPVKAGLIGRVVYTKHRYGIGYIDSVVIHLIIGGCVFSPILASLLMTLLYPQFDGVWFIGTAALSLLAAVVGAVMLQRLRPASLHAAVGGSRHGHSVRRWAAVLTGGILVGHAVLWFTAGRLYVAFDIFGSPIAYRDALFLAMVDSATRALFIANGLGLREWLIGFGASEGLLSTTPSLKTALAASLIDRAAEALVVVPIGLLSLLWLHHEQRRWAAAHHAGGDDSAQASPVDQP